VIDLLLDRYVYWFVLVLLAVGLWGVFGAGNLVKKLVGLVIFSTSIYVFFIHGSLEDGATAPVIDPEIGTDPGAYMDPLPHLLILTAIVVGVGVLGVGLALLVRIHATHGTFDEAVIAAALSGRGRPLGEPDDGDAEVQDRAEAPGVGREAGGAGADGEAEATDRRGSGADGSDADGRR
jgi:multicomponent Na+:H+ antiporter subunit C